MLGCTAILRCVIPTFVKEHVRVVSWVQDPAFFIYPSLQGGTHMHQFHLTCHLQIDSLSFRWKISFTTKWRSPHTQFRV
jgi:hypothetical protein